MQMTLDTVQTNQTQNGLGQTSQPQTNPSHQIDLAQVEAFAGKVLGDASGMAATIMASIGDRLGLFRSLAQGGPATSSQLAERTGLNERYTREWLGGMASAGYLTYDPLTQQFTLPAEHAPVLAQEGGPAFMGGIQQFLIGVGEPIDQVIGAFKHGGGVPQSAYTENTWAGLDRFTAGWFENLLLQQWVPAMPAVQLALERGANVADVGCGRGRALIKLAQAFPNSRFVGYDAYGPAVEDATARAAAAGVADRIRFEARDVSQGLPETYDIITTFDVIHDAVDPSGLLRAIHDGLRPGGRYVCLDINCSDLVEEQAGPLDTLRYGFSILYCMTTSLAHQGAGLGTVGLPESTLRTLCDEAGFGQFRRVPLENPFNNLYEIALAGGR
jgi:2-polyprenyl-3-methyl-5-hydroxy-6-metoxy-1,4-benzoquinol methylase